MTFEFFFANVWEDSDEVRSSTGRLFYVAGPDTAKETIFTNQQRECRGADEVEGGEGTWVRRRRRQSANYRRPWTSSSAQSA